jgi:hypothetical protein
MTDFPAENRAKNSAATVFRFIDGKCYGTPSLGKEFLVALDEGYNHLAGIGFLATALPPFISVPLAGVDMVLTGEDVKERLEGENAICKDRLQKKLLEEVLSSVKVPPSDLATILHEQKPGETYSDIPARIPAATVFSIIGQKCDKLPWGKKFVTYVDELGNHLVGSALLSLIPPPVVGWSLAAGNMGLAIEGIDKRVEGWKAACRVKEERKVLRLVLPNLHVSSSAIAEFVNEQ